MTSAEVALVKYDVLNDEIIRDSSGRCVPVNEGEPGLLLGKITEDAVFEGYRRRSHRKEIIRDALESGDAWFNTGDLMQTVDVGFTMGYPHYQFVDRVGDTSLEIENVSRMKWAILNSFDQIEFCNVYGVEVPGMTASRHGCRLLKEGVSSFDLNAFATTPMLSCPATQCRSLCDSQDIDVTGTFKMVKGDLRKDTTFVNALIRSMCVCLGQRVCVDG